MMRSMFMGVSGLRNHQTMMDVIGNNIANVNTIGFKSSRVTFQELFSQTLRGAVSPQDGKGGINPMQIGSGVTISSIDTNHTQGSPQPTANIYDLAIDGNGFFILGGATPTAYSRAGNFSRDGNGYLTAQNGMYVYGWMAEADGTFTTKDISSLTPLRIPIGQSVNPMATANISFAQNLQDGSAAYSIPIEVFDSKGATHTVDFTFTPTGTANEWDWEATFGGTSVGDGTITFNTDGTYDAVAGDTITIDMTAFGAEDIDATIDFSAMTQNAEETTLSADYIDGYPAGSLQSFTIGDSGEITGIYSNGLTRTIGQLAVAAFNNPSGLLKLGENMYTETTNSGLKQIGEPNTGGRGSILPSNLEMSNVDLAQEFTNMIITQRGFQANSRIITTSDEMLQELVNLKR